MPESPNMRGAAADVVSQAIADMAPTASDVGDVLSGALAGVIFTWLRVGKDPMQMRAEFHRLADEHFDFLTPHVRPEVAHGV